jgi:hypothetical protein
MENRVFHTILFFLFFQTFVNKKQKHKKQMKSDEKLMKSDHFSSLFITFHHFSSTFHFFICFFFNFLFILNIFMMEIKKNLEECNFLNK